MQILRSPFFPPFVTTLALGAVLEVLFNQTKAERDKRWRGRFVLCGCFGWSYAECDDVCGDVLRVMATLRGLRGGLRSSSGFCIVCVTLNSAESIRGQSRCGPIWFYICINKRMLPTLPVLKKSQTRVLSGQKYPQNVCFYDWLAVARQVKFWQLLWGWRVMFFQHWNAAAESVGCSFWEGTTIRAPEREALPTGCRAQFGFCGCLDWVEPAQTFPALLALHLHFIPHCLGWKRTMFSF